jgi:hypothetical protein
MHRHPVDAALVPMWTSICAEGLARMIGAGHGDRLGTGERTGRERVPFDLSKNASRRFCSTTCQTGSRRPRSDARESPGTTGPDAPQARARNSPKEHRQVPGDRFDPHPHLLAWVLGQHQVVAMQDPGALARRDLTGAAARVGRIDQAATLLDHAPERPASASDALTERRTEPRSTPGNP